MKALVKPRPIEGQEWPRGLRLDVRPEPTIDHPDDVKVRVLAAGICGTDLGIYTCKSVFREAMARAPNDPVVVGHEFCGVPVDAGEQALVRMAEIIAHNSQHDSDVDGFTRGRPAEELARDSALIEFISSHFVCSAEMHVTCGWCFQCRVGAPHTCQNTVIKGVHDDGAFADYVKVPASNLILLRRGELPVEIIAFMDAIGNAVHMVQAVDVAGKNIAVLGAGVQGLMAIAAARRSGAGRIYVTDSSPASADPGASRIDSVLFTMARRFGANHCFDMAKPGARDLLTSAVMDETDGTGVDAVLEASGNYHAYRNGLDIVRMGGTMALLGIPDGELPVDFGRDIIFRGITVKGIIGRRVFETWEAMRNLLGAGLADDLLGAGFISHELPLEDFETGIDAMLRRDAIKVILKP